MRPPKEGGSQLSSVAESNCAGCASDSKTLPQGWRDLCLQAYNAREVGPSCRLGHGIVLYDCLSSGAGARPSSEGVRLRSAVRWVALGSEKELQAGEDLVLFTLRLEGPTKNGKIPWSVAGVRVLKSVPLDKCFSTNGTETARSGVSLLRLALQSRPENVMNVFDRAQDEALGMHVLGSPLVKVSPPTAQTTPCQWQSADLRASQASPSTPHFASPETPRVPLASGSLTPRISMTPNSPGQRTPVVPVAYVNGQMSPTVMSPTVMPFYPFHQGSVGQSPDMNVCETKLSL